MLNFVKKTFINSWIILFQTTKIKQYIIYKSIFVQFVRKVEGYLKIVEQAKEKKRETWRLSKIAKKQVKNRY